MALTASGTLWSWGSNNFGQLGRETEEQLDSTPRLVEILPQDTILVDAGCGEGFSCAVTQDGAVWRWGGLSLGDKQTSLEKLELVHKDYLATGVACGELREHAFALVCFFVACDQC
jgi:alpha-tubulin suppressor-like RCC1 family protein